MKHYQNKVVNFAMTSCGKLGGLISIISNYCESFEKIKRRYLYTSLLYFVLLCLAYFIFIRNQYGMYGSYYYGFSLLNFSLSLFCIVLVGYFLPKKNEYTSSIFIHIQFLIMYMPMFVLSSFGKESIIPMLGITAVLMIQITLVNHFLKKKIEIIKDRSKLSYMNVIIFAMIAISIAVVIYSTFVVRFPSLKAFNLYEVYELRGVNNLSTTTIYLANWVAIAINPFLIVYLFDKKDYKKGCFVLFLQILMYMIFVYKSYFFSLAVIIIFYWWSKKGHILISLHLGVLFAVFISLLLYVSGLKVFFMIPALVINRLLFIPASIKFCYFDYFTWHDYLNFSEGFIGKIFNMTPMYEPKGISYYINEIYFPNSPGSNSNTGYISDAFANMGWLGVLIIGILIIALFIFIDRYNKKVNRFVIIGIFSYIFILYNDSAFLTSLLTGGVGILLGIVVFLNIPWEKLKKIKQKRQRNE